MEIEKEEDVISRVRFGHTSLNSTKKKVSTLRVDVYIANYRKRSSLYFCTARGTNNRGRH